MGAFDLLHVAEDASGDEAVAKVVRVKAAEAKAAAEAAAAKKAADKEAAKKRAEERGEVWVDPEPEEPKPKERKKKGPAGPKGQQAPQPQTPPQQTQPQQPDGEGDESPRENNARGAGRGRGQAIVGGSGGGFQGGRGNVRVLYDSSGNRIYENAGDRGYNCGNNTVNGAGYGYNNGNRGYNNGYRRYNNGYSNANGGDNQVNNENNGQYQQAYNENNGHYQQDGHYSNNNYGQRQGQTRKQYVPKSKPASEPASDADQKSEGKVEKPAAETPQKEAIAENVDAAPASESEKSAGDVAKDETKKVEGEGGEPKPKKQKDPNVKGLSGSAKKKLRKKNPKKEDSNDGDASKNTTDIVPEVIEEEKQEMTLEEYEKKLGKKEESWAHIRPICIECRCAPALHLANAVAVPRNPCAATTPKQPPAARRRRPPLQPGCPPAAPTCRRVNPQVAELRHPQTELDRELKGSMGNANAVLSSLRRQSQDESAVNLVATSPAPVVATRRGVSTSQAGARTSPVDVDALDDGVPVVSASQMPALRRSRRTRRPAVTGAEQVHPPRHGFPPLPICSTAPPPVMSTPTDSSPPQDESHASTLVRCSSPPHDGGTAAETLIDELLLEIISHVPARERWRCKQVCKHWLCLAKTLPQSLAGFFYTTYSREPMYALHFLINVSGNLGDRLPIYFSFDFLPVNRRIDLLDCRNGLLLCRLWGAFAQAANKFIYVVCNPATQEWFTLPDRSLSAGMVIKARLGFDLAVSSHFHVFLLLYDYPHISGVDLYSSKTGKWVLKEKDCDQDVWINDDREETVFLNGYLHFCAYFNDIDDDLIACIAAVATDGTWTIVNVPFVTKDRNGLPHDRDGFIQLSQGRLHYACFEPDADYRDWIAIYVIEDYDSKQWTLKHKVQTTDFFGGLVDCHKDFYFDWIAIHPECNVIFFAAGDPKQYMCYNMDLHKVKLMRTPTKGQSPYLPYAPLYTELQSLGM